MSKPPTPANDLFQEEADGPLVADRRNFFKLELWTRDGRHVERLLFAGNSLDKAHALFASYGKKRPRALSRRALCDQQRREYPRIHSQTH